MAADYSPFGPCDGPGDYSVSDTSISLMEMTCTLAPDGPRKDGVVTGSVSDCRSDAPVDEVSRYKIQARADGVLELFFDDAKEPITLWPCQ